VADSGISMKTPSPLRFIKPFSGGYGKIQMLGMPGIISGIKGG